MKTLAQKIWTVAMLASVVLAQNVGDTLAKQADTSFYTDSALDSLFEELSYMAVIPKNFENPEEVRERWCLQDEQDTDSKYITLLYQYEDRILELTVLYDSACTIEVYGWVPDTTQTVEVCRSVYYPPKEVFIGSFSVNGVSKIIYPVFLVNKEVISKDSFSVTGYGRSQCFTALKFVLRSSKLPREMVQFFYLSSSSI